MIFQFFIPYHRVVSTGVTKWVKDHRKIAAHYIRSAVLEM